MVRGPLCRPNSSPDALFETEIVFEKHLLCCTGKSSLPLFLNSFRRPSLEERHQVWASFSCRKNDAESPSELVQYENVGESPSKLDSECTSECIKLRRRADQDLEIETDGSPSKNDQAIDCNCTSREVGFQFPSPPSGPREKSLSPKDLKEMKKTSIKALEERESPISHPPTPPTMPRMSQAPRYRRRFKTASEVSSTSSNESNDEVSSEKNAQEEAGILLGDFRQCPGQFWDELHAKFSREAPCRPESFVPKKTVPALTSRQLGNEQDNELSESWKRFERRKLMRKERSRSKNRLHVLNPTAGSLWSKVLRLCGRSASQLAQPPEAFSYRSTSFSEKSVFVTEVESTAYRRWT